MLGLVRMRSLRNVSRISFPAVSASARVALARSLAKRLSTIALDERWARWIRASRMRLEVVDISASA